MSIEIGRFGRKITASGAALACAATMAGVEAPPVAAELGNQCGKYALDPKYTNHEFEVCNAYVLNDAGFNQPESKLPAGALTPFYSFGADRNREGEPTLRNRAFTHHFRTRYWLKARDEIEARVAKFPEGRYLAENTIIVNSLHSNLKANRAIIDLTESWNVGNLQNPIVYRESGVKRSATLCRVREAFEFNVFDKKVRLKHPLHEWVVVSFKALPTFNCNYFSKQVENGKIK